MILSRPKVYMSVPHCATSTERRSFIEVAAKAGAKSVTLVPETLAAAIGEEAVTIEDVYEPYLLQIGFLSRTPRGRCITAEGCRHLGYSLPRGAVYGAATQPNLLNNNH